MIKVEKIKNEADRSTAFEIRKRVFVLEQQVDPEEEYDMEDAMCTHFLAWFDGIPCGTARWRFKSPGIIKLERFAVDAAYRNKGVGAALLLVVLEDLPYADKIMLHAQIQAVPFYRKYGFVTEGEEFGEAGIRHYAMYLKTEAVSF